MEIRLINNFMILLFIETQTRIVPEIENGFGLVS